MAIRECRINRDLTQQELAHKLNVRRETIARYESGARKPPIEKAKRLAAALGCTLDELVRADTPRKEA